MTPATRYIDGYEAHIHRALWERILSFGAPRIWSTVWLVTCLYAGLMCLTILGVLWVLLPVVVWALGQGALVLLTQWDSAWDDIALAHLTRRYRSHYEAG